MKRRFASRVETERKVLRLVNCEYKMPSLNGLTNSAIESWRLANPSANDEIAEVLRSIAKKVQIEADASRDVFDEKELAELSTIDDYLCTLDMKLKG